LASFIALYHGETISSAELIATSAEPDLVRDLAERLLATPETQQPDGALRELALGRQRALRLVRDDTRR